MVSVTLSVPHTWIGDLQAKLVAPSGATFGIWQYPTVTNAGNSSNNLNLTVSVDTGSTAALGTWQMCVRDVALYDVGYIDFWSITFP